MEAHAQNLQAENLLLDARDPRRLYLWAAGCPDGPSAMLRVRNVHTVSELNVQARRCAGVRNLLVFDKAFDASVDRRLLKTLLTRALSVPRGAAKRIAVSGASGAAAAADERWGVGWPGTGRKKATRAFWRLRVLRSEGARG